MRSTDRRTFKPMHLAGELFKSMARVQIVHIPYKGAPQALTDVIAGQVQLMFASVTSAKVQMDARLHGQPHARRAHEPPHRSTLRLG